MADAHFGGGGSVFWRITTDKLRSPADLTLNHVFDNSLFTENGVDRSEGAAYETNFLISILPPKGVSAEEFIRDFSSKYAQAVNGRVQFTLPIPRPEGQQYIPQISVGWGSFVAGTPDPTRRIAV